MGFNKIKHLHLPDDLSGEKQVLEKFSFYKNLLFPLNSYSEKSHLKNGWLQGGIFSVYQMCKLLVGISIFGDFSFGIIFQQVSLRLVTHCAGGFVGWFDLI